MRQVPARRHRSVAAARCVCCVLLSAFVRFAARNHAPHIFVCVCVVVPAGAVPWSAAGRLLDDAKTVVVHTAVSAKKEFEMLQEKPTQFNCEHCQTLLGVRLPLSPPSLSPQLCPSHPLRVWCGVVCAVCTGACASAVELRRVQSHKSGRLRRVRGLCRRQTADR
jgi:hypothetical protein